MKRNPLRSFLPYVCAVLIAPLIAAWPQRAQAATLFWDGTDTTANADGGAGTWTTAGAWDSLATAGVNTNWTNGDVANFGGTAGTVSTPSALTVGNITFSTTGYTISGAGTITLSTSTINTGAFDATISSILAGTTAVTKSGAGPLTLSGANTYTGAFNVSAGTLKMGNATALGTTAGATTVTSGAVLDVNGQTVGTEGLTLNGTGISSGGALINSSGTAGTWGGTIALNSASSIGGSGGLTLSGVISGANALTKVGAGTLTLSGTNTYTGASTISAGTVIAQNNAAFGTTAGGITIASGAALNLGGAMAANAFSLGSETISVSGSGVGGTGAILATGSNGQQNAIQGTVTLTGATTFGGTQRWDIRNATLNGGGFDLTKVGANSIMLSGSSQMSSLGKMIIRQGEMVFETGALATSANTTGILIQPTAAVAAAFRSWGNEVTHSADIALDSSFAGSTARLEVQNGSTTHSGTITATGSDNRLDVDGSQTMTLTGVLAGSGTIRKEDNGLLLINGTSNTHSGNFIVNGGILGGTGILSSPTVNLNNGVTLSPGSSALTAGTLGVPNNLISNATNTGLFTIGTASDLVNTGTLTQNGTTNIAIIPGPGAAAGTYTLYNFTTLNGTTGFAGFSLGGSHVDGTLTNTGSSIQLNLNSISPLVWNGNSNNQWNTGTPTHPALPNFTWLPVAGDQVEFLANDGVLFDDTNTGSTTIAVNSSVRPGSFAVNNSTLDYTLDTLTPGQSGGDITGQTGLTKKGTGTLTLLGAPTFTGGIAVNAGTLQLGDSNRVATLTGGNSSGNSGVGPAINIATGANLKIATGNDAEVNYTNNISGGGNITLNAGETQNYFNYTVDRGNTRFSGDNNAFTGSISILDHNRLSVTSANGLGAASGITVQDGGGLLVNAPGLSSSAPLTIAGQGWAETGGKLGALRVINGGTLNGDITMTGDSRITANNGTGTGGTLTGIISGAHDLEYGLNTTGGASGTLNITNPASTYSGDTTITRTTVNAATIADSGSASSLGAGSTLSLENASLTFTGAGAMSSNRTISNGTLGIGGSSIGVSNPGATLTLDGAITTGLAAGSGVAFPQRLDFQQTLTAGTGGTIVLDLATPVVTGGTNVHRQTLTLMGNTSLTMAPSAIGVGGTFKLGSSSGTNNGNATLNLQDNAVLTSYGDLDIGNDGAANTYTVNQSGNSTVNALRGGTILSSEGERAMRIGHWSGETSVYNLNGGTINVPNNSLWVSYDGGGTMNQNGGTVNVEGLRMVRNATLTATYNLGNGAPGTALLNVGALGFSKGGTGTTVPTFNFNGGTYRATASHSIGSGIVINFQTGGGTIDTNGFDVSSASALLAGGTGDFTKTGAGEFSLTGINTLPGATNVNGGSLGGTASISVSTVNVGPAGTLTGALTVNSPGGTNVAGRGTISPGLQNGAAAATFTTSTLTLAPNSQLNLKPGAGAAGDLINVTGVNGLAGTTNINVLPVGPLAPGTYPLVDYAGTNSLAFTSALPHLLGASVTDNVAGTVIELTHTGQETLTWTGAGGTAWDATTPNTWNASTSGAVNYLQGDVAVFDDTSAVGGVTIATGGVTPASVTFNNSATAYTLTGGAITGGTSVVKTGSATTILAGDNTYTGGTTISGGTFQIGNGGATGLLGKGDTSVASGATLSFDRTGSSSYGGVISGAGGLRSDGTGTTTLTRTNTFTGGTVISQGTLEGNHDSFGSGTITLNDASTGTADTALLIRNGAAVVIPNNIVVSNNGTGTATIGSSEDSGFPTGLEFSGTAQFNRPTRLLGDLDRTTFKGALSGTVGTLTIGRSAGLEDMEIGRVVLEKAHGFTGPVSVVIEDNAILQINNISNTGTPNTALDQIPDTASVTLGNNASFQTGASGSASDGETIGDLSSTFVTSRVLATGGTAADLTFGTANNTTFNGVVNGANTFSLIKQGTGTFTMGGTMDNPSGRLIANSGTVILNKDSSNVVHAVGGGLTINTGATVKLGGTYTAFRDDASNRDNASQYWANAPSNFGDQIYNNVDVTLNTGGTLDMGGKSEVINGLIGTGGTVTNSMAGTDSNLIVGSNGSTASVVALLQDGAGTLSLTKGGTGTMVLNGAVPNTYTGSTDIRGGTLTIQNPGALGSASTGTTVWSNRENTGGSATQLNINITTASTPAAPNTLAEPITLVSELVNDLRAAINNAAESTRLTGPIVIQGDGINQILASQGAGDQLQLNGGITGTASGTLFLRGNGEFALNSVINAPNVILSKTDVGLLILNSTGNNVLETNLVNGSVRTDVVNAMDPSAILRMGQAGNVNSLDLNGNNQTVAGLVSNVGIADNFARTISSTAPATLTVNTPAATGADRGYGYTISGAITLQKTGAGDQVLLPSVSGNSLAYTGGTIVSEGTLRLAANDRIPDATGNVVVGDGSGDAFLDLNGYNDTINGLHGNANGTVHSNGSHLLTPLTAATSVLTVRGTATPATNATFSGTLQDNVDTGLSKLALTKIGAGTQIIDGVNTYTGPTAISGGTLLINGNNGGATGVITVASTATLGGTGTLGGALTVNGGGIFSPGNTAAAGTLTTNTSSAFSNTSVLKYDFLGTDLTVGGANNDLFTGITTLTLDGVLDVTEPTPGSFLSASIGDMWRLMNYTGILTDNTLDLGSMPALASGNFFAVDTSIPGQVNLVVVPETSTFCLLGLSALWTLRRRRTAA